MFLSQVGVVAKLYFNHPAFTAFSFKILISQPSISYLVILSEEMVLVRIRRAYSHAPFVHALRVPEVYQ